MNTTNMTPEKMEVDLLGFMGNEAKDLGGYPTLLNELIQNADDAPNVYTLTFDITDNALIVENNGIFSDPDFENIKRLACQGKRRQEGTTGNFGIGFISVYHITDAPILESNKVKYIFKPNEGYAYRSESTIEKTRFTLKWAKDESSKMRKALSLPIVTENDILKLFEDFNVEIPKSMLFLRKLKTIELKRNGLLIQTAKRELTSQGVISIKNNNSITSYKVFTGEFFRDDVGEQYINLLEEKKRRKLRLHYYQIQIIKTTATFMLRSQRVVVQVYRYR